MTDKRFVVEKYSVRDMSIDEKYVNSSYYIGDKGIAQRLVDLLNQLNDENEQLKTRNDRQAKQLDRLYHLIAEKDWRTLSDILDDFKRCEEQLQRESGIYW